MMQYGHRYVLPFRVGAIMAESSRPHARPSLVLGVCTRATAIPDARFQCVANRPRYLWFERYRPEGKKPGEDRHTSRASRCRGW